MDKRKIILDCDPGHDDAAAIMLAGASPGIELLGITAAAGNQTLKKTVRNALGVCQLLGINAPVYAGCPKPLVRERIVAQEIHGESGLDGAELPPLKRKAEEKHAVQYIIDSFLSSDGDIALAATGPMTNLAAALLLEPRIVSKIKEIVFMGGCFGLGNVTPAAEFNIYADAEAADAVFSRGIPLTMIGLDVTRRVLCTPAVMERMGRAGTKASKLFCDMMDFANRAQKRIYGFEGSPLNDPVVIAYIIDPSVLTVKPMYAEVDTASSQSYGRTNCDYYGCSGREPNITAAVDIDAERFWDMMEKALKSYA
jgi:ribosylpyrimidine nucleosidase